MALAGRKLVSREVTYSWARVRLAPRGGVSQRAGDLNPRLCQASSCDFSLSGIWAAVLRQNASVCNNSCTALHRTLRFLRRRRSRGSGLMPVWKICGVGLRSHREYSPSSHSRVPESRLHLRLQTRALFLDTSWANSGLFVRRPQRGSIVRPPSRFNFGGAVSAHLRFACLKGLVLGGAVSGG